MAKTPEGDVKDYAYSELRKIGCLVRKISYEGRNGCPDLLIVSATGRIVLVELKKSETMKADPHQQREHIRITKRGATVKLIGSRAQVDALVAELFPGER
jgi:hypothetical protein